MTDVGQNIDAKNAQWSFSGDVAKTFSEHVKLSVPLYSEGQELTANVSEFFISKNSVIYDLGCSLGTLTSMLADRHISKSARVIGIDNEKDMINEAQKINKRKNIKFFADDIVSMEFEKSNFISCYYTIQFIHPSVRQIVFEKIYDSLNWGGGFVLFEKVRSNDARFQDYITQLYNEFKLKQGFTPDNIISKSLSLKSVLEPFSTQGNIDMLKRAGFKDIITIQKYLSFEGFLAIK